MPPARIIDAHQHFWDLGRIYYPWLSDRIDPDYLFGDYAVIRRNYMPDDYKRDTRHWKIALTVHVEAECADGQQLAETAFASEMHARSGFPNAIIGHAWLTRPDLEEELRRHMAYPLFRGVRSKPRVGTTPRETGLAGPGTMHDPEWRRGLGVLERLGLVYDFRVPYYHLKEGAALPRLFPALQFVVVHTGVPRERSEEGLALWREGMRALAAAPNVAVKISGLSLPGRPWSVELQRRVVLETIEIFGVERAMFASNFPADSCVTDFDTMMTNFDRIVSGLGEDERDRIYYRNAEKYYRPAA